MESVGASNFAAMSVCFSSCSRLRRTRMMRKQRLFFGYGWHGSHCLQVKASSGSESCVAVKEDFADEEDHIKAGGSELLFVQMQQNKPMELQSKLADKVRLF